MTLPEGVAAIFPYGPNWAQMITQGMEYQTSVITSRDGTEQRIALRSKPRETLSYQVLLEGHAAAEFEYRLWSLQPYVLMLPHWPLQRRLTASAGLGSNQLLLDSPAQDGIAQGDEWILLADDDFELVTLEAISPDRKTLTLTDLLITDWPQWTRVYPAWRVQLSAEVRTNKLTKGVVKAPLQFRRLVGATAGSEREASADLTIGSLEVLTRRMNWAQPLQIEHNWVAQFIDAEIGPFSFDTLGDLPKRFYKGELLLESRTEIEWWQAFFDRCRGRQVPFLMPTWQDDLKLHTPIGATDFEVAGTALGIYQPADPIHTHIMLRKRDGSLAFFTVDTIDADLENGVTSITTLEPWDETYGPEECPFACFMNIVRMASDMLEIRWITDEVAKVALAVQTVEDVA